MNTTLVDGLLAVLGLLRITPLAVTALAIQGRKDRSEEHGQARGTQK